MTYLQNKKLTFMSMVNSVKGFVRNVSGVPPLTLPDCVDGDSLINYTISGNSIQNGTPTPENPIEVKCVGDYDEKTGKYKIPVVCSGNNMLNSEWLELGTLYDHNGATGNSSTRVRTKLIPLDAGKYYIRIYPYNNLSLRLRGIHVYNYNTEQWESYTAWSSVASKLFTISALCKVRFIFQASSNAVITVNDVIGGNPMLALSDTAVVYEPYIEPVTTNIYLDEPLAEGETLKNPVKLPTIKGTTIYTIGTDVQPADMSATYYATSKE